MGGISNGGGDRSSFIADHNLSATPAPGSVTGVPSLPGTPRTLRRSSARARLAGSNAPPTARTSASAEIDGLGELEPGSEVAGPVHAWLPFSL